jgi:uncharacterized repeat protein (TIGR01451 family)
LERESDTMKIFNRTILCKQATASSILRCCIGLILLLAFASATVFGQTFTFINPPTTTTPYVVPVTAPTSGLILPGTNINPATGQPVRYLWYGDAGAVAGLCRVDPDVDSAGPHTINTATCITTVSGVGFTPGPAAYDPLNGNIYVVNQQKAAQGVFRLPYDPAADGGNGLISPAAVELAGVPSGKVVNVGCPFSATFVTPNALALGPDGSVYMGFKRGAGGGIFRIKHPNLPVDTANCGDTVQMISNTLDHKVSNGLAFAGHDLYGSDSNGAFVITNADTCVAGTCPAQSFGTVGLPIAIASDQIYPSLSGHNLYFASLTAVVWVGNVNGTGAPTIASPFGGAGNTIAALAVDASNTANEVVYFGDDPSGAGTANAGRIFSVSQVTPAPAAPGAPINVKAVAAPASATVTWSHAADLQLVTSYLVHASFTSDGSIVPDVTVLPDAITGVLDPSATINGLTNGVSYQFTVQASSLQGASPFSAPSNTVTPLALTAPGAPTSALAVAGDALASVSWVAPASNGGSPITSYTVTTLLGGVPTGAPTAVAGNVTSVFVTGLSNGTAYTFSVHATNAIGDGPESAPSNSVTPSRGTLPPDLSVAVSSPGAVDPNTLVPFVVTVTNNGPTPAAHVLVSDTFAGQGVTVSSVVPAQGACTQVAPITCDLGFLTAGASATVTVNLQLVNAGATNVATVSAKDAGGVLFTDPTPANNTTSSSTQVNQPAGTTTDVQVTGSSSNGGPNVNTAINYTWQVRDAQSQPANNLVFTDVLPATLRFNSVTATLGGVCTAPAVGSNGGTVSCSLGTLNGGQTMIVTVNVTPTQTGTIANKGTATFNGTDTNTANNSFNVNITAK